MKGGMMKREFIIVGICIVFFQFCFMTFAEAKLYTWVDRNGVTRRTYYPPPPEQVMKKGSKKPTVQRSIARNNVELYVTSWCPYCKKAITYFKERGISITVYDIEKDPDAAARKKEMDTSGGGVPFAVINGYYVSGYSPSYYERVLNASE